MVDTVEIIHDELSGGTYRFLADFFRLIGAHVRDCTLDNETSGCHYDCMIIVEGGIKPENLEVLCKNYPTAIKLPELLPENESVEESSGYYVAESPGEKKDFLHHVLKLIRELCRDGNQTAIETEYEALLKIAGIYVDYDIVSHRNAYTFFYQYPEIVKRAQQYFSGAYIELRNIMKKEEGESKYAIYTMINLARYINETCKFRGERFTFDTGECLKRLDDALKVDPRFYNVYVLKAFIAEGDAWHSDKAAAYYQKAFDKIGNLPYMSYPCYRRGRYYERMQHDAKTAALYYEEAQELNVLEYRSVYKKILAEKNAKKYFESIESCKEICNILRKKAKGKYLQPRECEYLFKAYHEMSKIYDLLGDDKERDEAIKNRNLLCEEIRIPNRIYRQTFSSTAKEYAQLTAERLMGCVDVSRRVQVRGTQAGLRSDIKIIV